MRWLNVLLLSPALGAYNETRAIEYANLAGAAYCDQSTLSSWSCGPKCIKTVTSVKVCQGSTTQALVGMWNGKCLLSFEGTNGLSAVKVDMHALKTAFGSSKTSDCAGCMVHSGFLHEWQSLKGCMIERLRDIGCDYASPLHATGHSLGGAVVAIGMLDLKNEGWNVAELYNFGSPRIGNTALTVRFNEMFQGHFFRVTHGRDPFIDMPLGPFYRQVEPEVFYKAFNFDGKYVICTDEFDPKCSYQFWHRWWWAGAFNVVMKKEYVAYHHNYMGVATTQADCAWTQSCKADIQQSWCTFGIPCNREARGPCYCDHGPIWKGGYGKCHCDAGYCPKDGKCEPSNQTEDKTGHTVIQLSAKVALIKPSTSLPLAVPVSSVMACLAVSGLLIAFATRRFRARAPTELRQHFIET